MSVTRNRVEDTRADFIVGWNPCYSADPTKPMGNEIHVGCARNYGWSYFYQFTSGACDLYLFGYNRKSVRVGQMMLLFHNIVVRDGIDPVIAHNEFMKIAEYRDCVSPDLLTGPEAAKAPLFHLVPGARESACA